MQIILSVVGSMKRNMGPRCNLLYQQEIQVHAISRNHDPASSCFSVSATLPAGITFEGVHKCSQRVSSGSAGEGKMDISEIYHRVIHETLSCAFKLAPMNMNLLRVWILALWRNLNRQPGYINCNETTIFVT